MKQISAINFSGKKTNFIFGGTIQDAIEQSQSRKIVFITDELILNSHAEIFLGYPVISIPSGEKSKIQSTIDNILQQLIEYELDKDDFIVGVGGGVVTDIAGFIAAVYKRGTRLGLMPTSILAMVDAAIGGKNGINHGQVKNMIGTIYQPDFIVFDFFMLKSLPDLEWVNGFAEIIKHACIKDADLFDQLEQHSLNDFKADLNFMSAIINRNVIIKSEIVIKDELDKSDRKLLNFGHTFGHAVENIYQLPHGFAVSIGMVVACKLSEQLTGLSAFKTNRIVELLSRYGLPVHHKIDHDVVFDMIKKDKKRNGENIDFVLLNDIGDAHAKPVSLSFIKENLPYLIS